MLSALIKKGEIYNTKIAYLTKVYFYRHILMRSRFNKGKQG